MAFAQTYARLSSTETLTFQNLHEDKSFKNIFKRTLS